MTDRPDDARVLLESGIRHLDRVRDELLGSGRRVPVDLWHAMDFLERARSCMRSALLAHARDIGREVHRAVFEPEVRQ